MTRVVAPCRLHFGLFHVPVADLMHWPDGTPVRKYGGVGMMVERPAVVVEVRRSTSWTAAGVHGKRAMEFARRVWERQPEVQSQAPAFAIQADGPPEHVGLGVGTALGMAAGDAVFRELKLPQPDFPVSVARLVGRGERSGIGVHGYALGGLIVDGGKVHDDEIADVVERLAVPEQWRVVLVRPSVESAWHGDRERAAFCRSRPVQEAAATTARLHELAFGQLLPAVRSANFPAFADAVHEYNRTAGEPFDADQGGPYAGPAVTGMIEGLRAWGVAGVGQSSWGPTVFAFAADPGEADRIAKRVRDRFPALADVTVSAVNNSGVPTAGGSEVQRSDSADQPDQ